MQEWHSANEITKRSGLPGSTARRYLSTFQEFFMTQASGKQRRYSGESVSTLQRIAELYEAKQTTAEIKETLQRELQFMYIDIADHEREQPNHTSIISHMEAQTTALLSTLQSMSDNMSQLLEEHRISRQEVQELRERITQLEQQIKTEKQGRKWWRMFTR
jgi:chromosome segregation ATPase